MASWVGLQNATYRCVQTMDQFRQVYAELIRQKVVAVDTETSGLDWVHDHACGIVLGWGIENNYYFPIAHTTGEQQLDINEIRAPLSRFFEDRTVTKIFWNETFDRHFLRKEGFEVRGPHYDGVVMVHILDENREKGLKEVSCDLIARNADKWEESVSTWRNDEAKRRRAEFSELLKNDLKNNKTQYEADYKANNPMAVWSNLTKVQLNSTFRKFVREKFKDHPYAEVKKADITYDQVPLPILAPYACADVHYTYVIWKMLMPSIGQHDALRTLYVNEMELAMELFDVEHRGVRVDIKYLNSLEPVFEAEILELRNEIWKDVGYEFNIDSTDQLIDALKKAGCRLTKLTKKGKEAARAGRHAEAQFAVDKEVLEYLATEYEFADKILSYREKQKLLNTYVRGIRECVDALDYLHSTFNANVATGRMSSREPNVQNIPGKNLEIRRAFTIPEDGEYVFLFADYSQVELRLTAHWSQDPTLMGAYDPKSTGWIGKEQDVHSITCADVVMSRPLQEVLDILHNDKHPENKDVKWHRNIAKRVNFGIIYGAGPDAIQRQVSKPTKIVSRDDCERYIAKYFQKYQGVQHWIRRTEMQMKQASYLQNSFGRFRRLPNIKSAQKWERERAARQGVNFLIQGDAADLFKHAVVRVRNLLREHNAKTKIVNFVHDEIQFYLHKSEFYLLPLIKHVMQDFPSFMVPIIVDFAWSTRDWGSKKELKAA